METTHNSSHHLHFLSFVSCLTKCFTFFILLVLGGRKPLVSIAINHLKGSLCSLQRTSHTHLSKGWTTKFPTTPAQKGKKKRKKRKEKLSFYTMLGILFALLEIWQIITRNVNPKSIPQIFHPCTIGLSFPKQIGTTFGNFL